MKRLREKLHSQRGASILLALLLFLVCCMVAASILAAAASNAGKYRSNRVEQQKYLTLSSAIRLIADEIQQATYTGKYKVYEWEVTTTTVIGKDADDNDITTSHTDYYYHVEQDKGAYSCKDITAQLPLLEELDAIFSKQFSGTGYTPLSAPDIEEPASPATSIPHTLTVTLPDGLTGYPDSGPDAYKADKTVTVKVELDHTTKHIKLTAWLGDGAAPTDNSNTMTAELVVKEGTAPTIDYAPGGRTAGSSIPVENLSGNPSIKVTKNGVETPAAGAPMQWELHWIKKGAA